MNTRCAVLLVLLGSAQVHAQGPAAPVDLSTDIRLLQQNRLPTEGPGLLLLFRERTLSKDQVGDLQNQIKLLASPIFAERKKAEITLLKAGPLARKMLLELIKNKDTTLETIRRAETLLTKIAEGQDTLMAIATARLIAKHQPEGSGQTLLEFVPFGGESRLLEEVQLALNAVALKDGKIDPAFLTALTDKLAAKRAAAGEAIIRAGGKEHKKTVEPLLEDEAPAVRLAVALALVDAQDKRAVKTLIDLLPEAPPERVWQVEDMLHKIAADKAPEIWVGAKTSAKMVRTAWTAWWQTNQQTVNLAKLSEPPKYRGFILVTASDAEAVKARRGSKVIEVKPSKQVGWHFDYIRNLTDGQYLNKERALVAEGRKVTERDMKTNIFWEKECEDQIVACQRLPGGDTFIATRRELLLVDPIGKAVFKHKEQKDLDADDEDQAQQLVPIIGAGRARDGQMVFINQNGQCTWLDSEGFKLRSFTASQIAEQQLIGTIEVLPGHRILIPLADRVAEFDRDGRILWQVPFSSPVSALRLPHGNTLIANGQRVLEVDRNGREVWSYQPEGGAPFRLRRR
ncbi:MAG: HEAT repeat domain-containing protein [Planctomycetes bacterium]|nr:HEAT repeat domain-containing protein [Planctomycetota bacterium]